MNSSALSTLSQLEQSKPPGPSAPPKAKGKIKLIEAHPIANAFPMAPDDVINEIGQSILQNGQRLKGVVFEGMLLDGRNRQEACSRVNVEFEFREFDPAKEGSPAKYVADLNFKRRDLTAGQKAAAAVELIPFFQKEADELAAAQAAANPPAEGGAAAGAGDSHIEYEPGQGPKPTKSERRKTSARVAKLTGASRSSVEKAKKLKASDPKGFQKVKEGTETLNRAARKAQLENAFKRIGQICGAKLEKAARDGVRLKNKNEVIDFAKLPKDKMLDIQSLIENGDWKVKAAVNFKAVDLNETHRISDLIARAIKDGGTYTCEVEGYVLTASRTKKASAPAAKKSPPKKKSAKRS